MINNKLKNINKLELSTYAFLGIGASILSQDLALIGAVKAFAIVSFFHSLDDGLKIKFSKENHLFRKSLLPTHWLYTKKASDFYTKYVESAESLIEQKYRFIFANIALQKYGTSWKQLDKNAYNKMVVIAKKLESNNIFPNATDLCEYWFKDFIDLNKMSDEEKKYAFKTAKDFEKEGLLGFCLTSLNKSYINSLSVLQDNKLNIYDLNIIKNNTILADKSNMSLLRKVLTSHFNQVDVNFIDEDNEKVITNIIVSEKDKDNLTLLENFFVLSKERIKDNKFLSLIKNTKLNIDLNNNLDSNKILKKSSKI